MDALFISSLSNIFYLTGLKNIEGYLVISQNNRILFTDFRYLLLCKELCKNIEIEVLLLDSDRFNFIAGTLAKKSFKKVGFEEKSINYKEYYTFQNSFKKSKVKFLPTQDVVENFRKLKDSSEVTLIKKAAAFTQKAFLYLEELIYQGLTEKFVAVEAEKFLKLKADLEIAFPAIVAAGKSAAYPHHSPDDTKLRAHQPILIDLGSKYCGYCSDLTRVFFLSKMPLHLKKILDIIKKAQDLSISKIRGGIKISEVDKAARDYIDKKGYSKFFGHGLGHGVGIDVHELPFINSKNQDRLQEGMVITIEPGIYLPGKFGIREENMVLVKSTGAEVLNGHSRDTARHNLNSK